MNVILLLLIAANILGVAIGLFVYSPQIFAAHPLFWVFIPDCPLYVLLAALFYLKVLKNEFVRYITTIGLVKYGIWTISILFYYSGYFLDGWFGWLLVLEHIGMTLQFVLLAGPIKQNQIFRRASEPAARNPAQTYGMPLQQNVETFCGPQNGCAVLSVIRKILAKSGWQFTNALGALYSCRLRDSMLLAALGWFLLNDFIDYGLGMHPYFPSKEIGFVAGFTVVLSFASVAIVQFLSAKIGKNRTINAVKNILGSDF